MGQIIDKNLLEQYVEDAQSYSIIANRRRAIPDVRDGLKLVQRRIIEAMYYHLNPEQTVKTARVVGETMGRLHPHGDSSIAGAIANMVNWFDLTVPLIDGQGNFGNFQGKGPAAPRYTEVKLSKFALEGIVGEMRENRDVVDLVPNFDNTCMEPEYFPVKVPLLAINGVTGIGYGIKVDVPRHNLAEVIDATINLIKHPNASIVLIPDTCMPCEIIDTNWKEICNKGNGNYRVRGIIDIEEWKNKTCLVIKSVPDYVTLDSVTEKIEELVASNVLIGVSDLQADNYVDPKTKRDVMRYIIVLKKGADPNFIRDLIYKHTNMEKTALVNLELLNGIDLVRMSYKSYLENFIEFRRITKFRLYCNRLQYVKTKYHEKEAYIKLLESGEVDKLIEMIRKSERNDTELIEYLVNKLKITDLQAAFIINSNLKSLSKRYLNKYKEDAKYFSTLIDEYLDKIIKDDFDQEIIDELLYFKQKYGKPRQTKIISKADASNIPNGDFKIIITENNFIKKVHINDTIGSFRGDTPKYILKVENINNILIFDEFGKVFKLPVHKIPFTDKSSAGTDIRLLIKNLTANIKTIMYEPTVEQLSKSKSKHFLNIVTTMGYVKKLDLDDFLSVPPSGIVYMKLDSGDSIQGLEIVQQNLDVIIFSNTHTLRIKSQDVPHQKRNAKGVRSMVLKNDDRVDGLSVIYPNATHIVVVTENGMINKFDVVALPVSSRGKVGTKLKLKSNDKINSIFGVNDNNIIRITTKNETYDIPVSEIEPMSSVSMGKKMITTKGDVILNCSVYIKEKK